MILALLVIPLFAACVGILAPRERQSVIEYGAVVTTALEVVLAMLIARKVALYGALPGPAFLGVDALGAVALLMVSVVGLAAAIHSVGHLREEARKGVVGFHRIREYYSLFHLFLFAMFAAAATTSPIIMWTAIEATTLATAFLITFYNKPSALEAGWKNLIINSVGLLLGFLGTLLFLNAAAGAGATGPFVSWDTLHALAGSFDPTLIKIAFIFCLVGYGTKVGFVPMHTWLPDAHSKAPIPISALLSGVLLNMALLAILRLRAVTDLVVNPAFTAHLLIGFGALSLATAALIIFGQKNYKRMLAYSSIEHMGIMAIGFGIGGVAAVAALFHMLYHALLKPLLFFAAGNVFLKYSSTKIANVKGALTLLPFSSAAFFAGLLAVSGMPLSGIFFTKLSILAEGMHAYPLLMLGVLGALALVLAGFLASATAMFFSEAPANLPRGEANGWTVVSISFLAFLFIALSVYVPTSLTRLIEQAGAIIR